MTLDAASRRRIWFAYQRKTAHQRPPEWCLPELPREHFIMFPGDEPVKPILRDLSALLLR